MQKNLLKYFNGDEFPSDIWYKKYRSTQHKETTPDEMHKRMAKEFARIEKNYPESPTGNFNNKKLSEYGRNRKQLTELSIYNLFRDFKYIIPRGRVMAGLGITESYRSLCNCLRLPPPKDSYSSIMYTDTMLVSSAKRGCGYGLGLSNLRPDSTFVSNAANSSTGAASFMERYSNSTREVAQKGRRGACLLDMSIFHPDILEFITKKKDLTKVTGANISVKLYSEFMEAVEKDEYFILRFPCTKTIKDLGINEFIDKIDYNELREISSTSGEKVFYKKIKAKEYWDEIIENAWDNAEPGLFFWDRVLEYDPSTVYSKYYIDGTNACFHPDTLIETVKGKLRIADIIEDTYVYSMDSNEKLCISKASPSFISKINAKTLLITLQCGSKIQVTPDHKIYIHDKGWVEAQNLELKDRVVHLSKSKRGHKYIGAKLSTQGNREYKMEHRIIFEGVFGKTENDIHHVDNNSFNNNINNLKEIPHNEHAKITAIHHNPQNHQIRDETGQFVSTDIKIKRTHRQIDKSVSPTLVNQYSNRIVSIEEGETIDVYDIQVENTHCLIANGMVAHNCGEQPMAVYDTCRLILLNLYSFVKNPFTDKAEIDYKLLYETAYEQLRLGDDLVDLEIEYIDRIIAKIISDTLPEKENQIELDLWLNVRDMAESGRRVGCGITALADMVAAMGFKYDSNEGMELIEEVMRVKMLAELHAGKDLAIIRGTFEEWDSSLEFDNDPMGFYGKNDFYQTLVEEFPIEAVNMAKFGRRNVNWNTIAPAGSTSILAKIGDYFNSSSGCEPIFMPFHMRKTKVNPGDPTVRVDFVDDNGDSWMEYPIMMGGFKEWLKTITYLDPETLKPEDIKEYYKESPYYGSTANDIDWLKRVKIQGILQKYTTSAISSTLNLPKDISKEEVSNIYFAAWKEGLKGITIYRDGSRTGVLTTDSSVESFKEKDAVKRQKELKALTFYSTSKGENYHVIVGLFENKPYEIFIDNSDNKYSKEGVIVKEARGKYIFKNGGDPVEIRDFMTPEQQAITRLVSMGLRHRIAIKYIVEQLQKIDGDMFSFAASLARVLKRFIPDGEVSTIRCLNPECTGDGTNVIFQEGCSICQDCGSSACN